MYQQYDGHLSLFFNNFSIFKNLEFTITESQFNLNEMKELFISISKTKKEYFIINVFYSFFKNIEYIIQNVIAVNCLFLIFNAVG